MLKVTLKWLILQDCMDIVWNRWKGIFVSLTYLEDCDICLLCCSIYPKLYSQILKYQKELSKTFTTIHHFIHLGPAEFIRLHLKPVHCYPRSKPLEPCLWIYLKILIPQCNFLLNMFLYLLPFFVSVVGLLQTVTYTINPVLYRYFIKGKVELGCFIDALGHRNSKLSLESSF